MAKVIAQVEPECPLAGALANRLRDSKWDLVHQWLRRISERVSLTPQQIFPTEELLDHIPLLIDGIADYLEDPADEISAHVPVVGKAMELGALRHSQGFDAHQILKEYEILGGIVFRYLARAADELTEPCEKSELLVCGHRLFRAIAIIQQTTTDHFLRLSNEQVAEREGRLRTFNRALSHEIKNNVNAILGAGDILATVANATDEERDQFQDIIVRNARMMKGTLDNLVALARLEGDARQHRHVRLPEATREARRQMREIAQKARVNIVLSPDLPDVDVDAAAVELSLVNYLSNALKYADPQEPAPLVTISGRIDDSANTTRLVVSVQDNGLGVPPEKRDKLFQRFFRAHDTVTGAEGTGLGLSIVRETVERVGGSAWAEFPDKGSVFLFALPCRRNEGDRRQPWLGS
ncbi:MAG: ATP-binding protein [Gemmatimonadaceae bacterium]